MEAYSRMDKQDLIEHIRRLLKENTSLKQENEHLKSLSLSKPQTSHPPPTHDTVLVKPTKKHPKRGIDLNPLYLPPSDPPHSPPPPNLLFISYSIFKAYGNNQKEGKSQFSQDVEECKVPETEAIQSAFSFPPFPFFFSGALCSFFFFFSHPSSSSFSLVIFPRSLR